MNAAAARRQPERVMLRVIKGGLVPADDYVRERLRSRGYHTGDLLSAELRKARTPGFHRLAHRLGDLVAQNIDSFAGLTAHAVLKRLQWEANIGCDEMGVEVPTVGLAHIRIPRSLGYESMEEGEFREIVRAFCTHLATRYWPQMAPKAIERLAEVFVEPA